MHVYIRAFPVVERKNRTNEGVVQAADADDYWHDLSDRLTDLTLQELLAVSQEQLSSTLLNPKLQSGVKKPASATSSSSSL